LNLLLRRPKQFSRLSLAPAWQM